MEEFVLNELIMPSLKFINVTESYLFFLGHPWHGSKQGLNCLPLAIHGTDTKEEGLVRDGLELDFNCPEKSYQQKNPQKLLLTSFICLFIPVFTVTATVLPATVCPGVSTHTETIMLKKVWKTLCLGRNSLAVLWHPAGCQPGKDPVFSA